MVVRVGGVDMGSSSGTYLESSQLDQAICLSKFLQFLRFAIRMAYIPRSAIE